MHHSLRLNNSKGWEEQRLCQRSVCSGCPSSLFIYFFTDLLCNTDPFTLKILCSFGPHCVVLLALPVVSVCCLCFTWQESGTTLWLCLLFCNALGSPTQDTTGSANGWRETRWANERPGAGTVTTNQLPSLAISLMSRYWSKQDVFSSSMLWF